MNKETLVPNPMLKGSARNLTCPCASMMKVKDCTACGLRIKRKVKPATATKLQAFIDGAATIVFKESMEVRAG